MIKVSVPTYGKKDSIGFNPVDLAKNFAKYTGRAVRTEDQIKFMVESLLRVGQEVPFVYRKGFANEPIPISGHTRILAAVRIMEQGLTDANGTTYSLDNVFVVYGQLKKVSEEEAIFDTFAENDGKTRTPLNAVDISLMITTLNGIVNPATGKLWTDAEIAVRIGELPSWVSTHKAVTVADNETKAALISGEMNFATAQAALKVEPEQRKEVVAKAKATGGGKATAAGIAAAAVELGAKTKGAIPAVSISELKAVLKPVVDGPTSPEKIRAFAILDFLAHRITPEALIAALGNANKASA